MNKNDLECLSCTKYKRKEESIPTYWNRVLFSRFFCMLLGEWFLDVDNWLPLALLLFINSEIDGIGGSFVSCVMLSNVVEGVSDLTLQWIFSLVISFGTWSSKDGDVEEDFSFGLMLWEAESELVLSLVVSSV